MHTILPRGFSLAAGQKVKVEYATDDLILQRGRRLVIAELDVHPRRAEQQHGARAALKVHGIIGRSRERRLRSEVNAVRK